MIGYDPFYRSTTGPVARAKPVNGFSFELQNEVQGRSTKLSNSAVRNLIQISESSSGAGEVSYGNAVIITTTITPDNLYSDSKTFGHPYMAIYQGTSAVSSMQIYPYQGAGANVRDFEIRSGFDLGSNNATDWNGINSVFTVTIRSSPQGQ